MLLPIEKYLTSLLGGGLPLANEGGILLVQDTVPKKKSPTKKGGFGVFVTESPIMSKRYIKALLREIARYPKLKEESASLWAKSPVKNAVFGDTIIFGDTPEGFAYDYRLEKDLATAQVVCASEKVYDLVNEFSKARKALKKYYSLNYPTTKRTSSPKIEIEIEINLNRTPPVKERRWEKVTIFHNFVKVGFDQFDILVDKRTDKEYVEIDGKILRIKRDIFGNKVLKG